MEHGIEKAHIEGKIKRILSDKLGLEDVEIGGASLLMDELGLDSFDALRIIFEVEDEFDIKVPPAEVIGIRTVEDVVDYIDSRLRKRSA